MTDTTDISQLPTAGGNVSTPSSGVYGEGAALQRLKEQLPAVEQTAQEPGMSGAPMPTPPGNSSMPGSPPPGLPSSILSPTTRPDVPVSTPLTVPQQAPMAETGRQKRLAMLDALENDPNTGEATREWASTLRRALIQGSAQ